MSERLKAGITLTFSAAILACEADAVHAGRNVNDAALDAMNTRGSNSLSVENNNFDLKSEFTLQETDPLSPDTIIATSTPQPDKNMLPLKDVHLEEFSISIEINDENLKTLRNNYLRAAVRTVDMGGFSYIGESHVAIIPAMIQKIDVYQTDFNGEPRNYANITYVFIKQNGEIGSMVLRSNFAMGNNSGGYTRVEDMTKELEFKPGTITNIILLYTPETFSKDNIEWKINSRCANFGEYMNPNDCRYYLDQFNQGNPMSENEIIQEAFDSSIDQPADFTNANVRMI